MSRPEAAAEPPQGGDVVDGGNAVVEWLDVVPGARQVLAQPHVAVEADLTLKGAKVQNLMKVGPKSGSQM